MKKLPLNFIKYKKINMLCSFFLIATFFQFFLGNALAMEKVDDVFKGKYLIKNIKNSEFLFTDSKVANDTVRTRASIGEDSLCIFEKNAEGYLIKTVKYGEYLNVESIGSSIFCGSSLKWKKILESNSYFSLLRNNKNEYVIKSKKFSDYLYLSCDTYDTRNEGTSVSVGFGFVGICNKDNTKIVKMKNTIQDESFFEFILYQGNFF